MHEITAVAIDSVPIAGLELFAPDSAWTSKSGRLGVVNVMGGFEKHDFSIVKRVLYETKWTYLDRKMAFFQFRRNCLMFFIVDHLKIRHRTFHFAVASLTRLVETCSKVSRDRHSSLHQNHMTRAAN